jgi:hypothetical protein
MTCSLNDSVTMQAGRQTYLDINNRMFVGSALSAVLMKPSTSASSSVNTAYWFRDIVNTVRESCMYVYGRT